MKRMTIITMAAVLLGTILFLGGCEGLKTQGRLIKFKTSTGEVGTKTYYGDDYNASGTTWQYIVWEEGDGIRIVSDKAASAAGKYFADYVIDEVTENKNHQSFGTIAPTPNGLTWSEGQTQYNFYAVTPVPGTGAVKSIHGPDSDNYNPSMIGSVKATQPNEYDLTSKTPGTKYLTSTGGVTEEQASDVAYIFDVYAPDMDNAVMTATTKGFVPEDDGDEVSLLFKPAFTAFEFNMTSADEAITVSKVELVAASTSDCLAGSYTFIAGSDISTSSNVQLSGTTYQSIAVTMNNELKPPVTENNQLTRGKGITFTIFTIPKVNTDMISLVVTTDKGTATLNLTDTDKSSAYKFQPGKKYRINMLKVARTWDIDIKLTFQVQPWISADNSPFTINTNTGSINMTNVFWMNSKVSLTQNGDPVNTVDDGNYSVTMYYQPYVNGERYTDNNGYFPAQGYFTVNYPNTGLFKIGLIPAYGETTVDESQYEIYIYNSTTKVWDRHKSASQTWDDTPGMTITNNTVYFQVRAASGQDGSQYKAQIDIWFKPAGSSEWISAYSEVRANYALIIPAR